jgi:D-arabinose 1-dehydrogenase-like Zn-dependent alcohol dehydrogenase
LPGFLSGSKISFDASLLIMNYVRLQGYSVGNAKDLADLTNAFEKNNIKPVIDIIFPFEKRKTLFKNLNREKRLGK